MTSIPVQRGPIYEENNRASSSKVDKEFSRIRTEMDNMRSSFPSWRYKSPPRRPPSPQALKGRSQDDYDRRIRFEDDGPEAKIISRPFGASHWGDKDDFFRRRSNDDFWKTKESKWDNDVRTIETAKDGSKFAKLVFDLEGYHPNEVKVSTDRGNLLVSAEQELSHPNSSSYRRFHREISLPSCINPDALDSVLTNDGWLEIRAPIPFDFDPRCLGIKDY